MVANDFVEQVLDAPDRHFPSSSKMRGGWRIEAPLDAKGCCIGDEARSCVVCSKEFYR